MGSISGRSFLLRSSMYRLSGYWRRTPTAVKNTYRPHCTDLLRFTLDENMHIDQQAADQQNLKHNLTEATQAFKKERNKTKEKGETADESFNAYLAHCCHLPDIINIRSYRHSDEPYHTIDRRTYLSIEATAHSFSFMQKDYLIERNLSLQKKNFFAIGNLSPRVTISFPDRGVNGCEVGC